LGWAAADIEVAGFAAAGLAAAGAAGLADAGLTCASAGDSAVTANAPNSIKGLEDKPLPLTNLFILNGYPALPAIFIHRLAQPFHRLFLPPRSLSGAGCKPVLVGTLSFA
jgi:hypothetical protein